MVSRTIFPKHSAISNDATTLSLCNKATSKSRKMIMVTELSVNKVSSWPDFPGDGHAAKEARAEAAAKAAPGRLPLDM